RARAAVRRKGRFMMASDADACAAIPTWGTAKRPVSPESPGNGWNGEPRKEFLWLAVAGRAPGADQKRRTTAHSLDPPALGRKHRRSARHRGATTSEPAGPCAPTDSGVPDGGLSPGRHEDTAACCLDRRRPGPRAPPRGSRATPGGNLGKRAARSTTPPPRAAGRTAPARWCRGAAPPRPAPLRAAAQEKGAAAARAVSRRRSPSRGRSPPPEAPPPSPPRGVSPEPTAPEPAGPKPAGPKRAGARARCSTPDDGSGPSAISPPARSPRPPPAPPAARTAPRGPPPHRRPKPPRPPRTCAAPAGAGGPEPRPRRAPSPARPRSAPRAAVARGGP